MHPDMPDTLANEKALLEAELQNLMDGLESIGPLDRDGALRWLAGFQDYQKRIWAVEEAEGQASRSTFPQLHYQAGRLQRDFNIADEDVVAWTNASTASGTMSSSGGQ